MNLFKYICFSALLCLGAGSIVEAGASFSATSHSRWTPGLSYAPYNAALVSDIYTRISPTDNLVIKHRFTISNPSMSDGYLEGNELIGRFSLNSYKDFENERQLFFSAGDLGRITIGNGLTLKDFDAFGFKAGITGPVFRTELMYVGNSYAASGGYSFVNVSLVNSVLGLYLFSYSSDESLTTTYANTINLYSGFNLGKLFTVRAELGSELAAPSEKPFAGLLSLEFFLENPKVTVKNTVTGRYYFKSYYEGYNTYDLRKTHYDLEEESLDYDNWRNYLISAQSSPMNILALSTRTTLRFQLIDSLWLHLDTEFTRQSLGGTNSSTLFYHAGLDYEIIEELQTIYVGIQNRLLNSQSLSDAHFGNEFLKDSYSSINNPVITEVDPFFVMGSRLEF